MYCTLTEAALGRGSLVRLEELALLAAPRLDTACLEILIARLPCLTIVGRLQGWDISPAQLEPLKLRLRQQNFNLTLWYNLPMHVGLGIFEEDII